ncbi:ribonuclease P protein component [Sphingobacterium sp. HJSM2_6]|uniref:ribonuclease P protein component n=1 Tax=Sphingobacterium sp. HJSM2_6 TaxID=3366264 RepID=UPI003BC4F425
MKKNTFTKEERLCSKRSIDYLFLNGSSFVVYPFRIVYTVSSQESTGAIQAIISVSKRRFKRAVARNRIKRLMRECYRLEKHKLYDFLADQSLPLLLAMQYIGKEVLPYEELREKMHKLLDKLANELDKSNLGKGD